jgi:hypothetical protein
VVTHLIRPALKIGLVRRGIGSVIGALEKFAAGA